MAGLSFAERSQLAGLLLRRSARMAAGRLRGHPLVRWRLLPGKTDTLVIAPQDLRTPDSTQASEIYAGRFAFAGKVVTCAGYSPFEMPPPSPEWATGLFGFGWLRHLRSAESGITRANARALVDEWIALQGSFDPFAWRPDVLAQRVIAWLSHSPLILHDADEAFYRRFMRSLTRQVRYLRHTARETPEGVQRLHALIALTYASLCMVGQQRRLRVAIRNLTAEIDKQILPDGGHISRHPGVLVDLLLDLLPLRQVFAARNIAPPRELNNAIDRMMPMLRFFRHGDGQFAHFNGMGPTPSDLVATVLAYDDTRGTPHADAPHSGYHRVEAAPLLLLIDTGRPPPLAVSQDAHASALAFELSVGAQRLLVNCGLPTMRRDAWHEVARSTAAHSAAVLDDTSSCRFHDAGAFRRMIGAPVVSGPTDVTVVREETAEAIVLRMQHDGYAERFGLLHQRTLTIARNGTRIEGEDSFVAAPGIAAREDAAIAVRFHLHPQVKVSRLADGRSAVLMLPNRGGWTFSLRDGALDLEESVYLAGPDGPRRTNQIVIAGNVRETPRLRWTLQATAAPEKPAAPDDDLLLPL